MLIGDPPARPGVDALADDLDVVIAPATRRVRELGHASLGVANNSLSLPEQGVVQIVLMLALCAVILAFFRISDLRPRLGSTATKARQRVSE